MSLIIESLPPRSPGISLRPLFVLGALLFVWFISVALSTGLIPLGSGSSVILPSAELGSKLIPVLASFYALHAFIAVPSALSHLPRAPLLPILKSYLRGEPDDVRYRRYILPLFDEARHGVVLVWVLGRWMVHVLDWKLGRAMSENAVMEKESPPDDLLLWDFVGRRNFIFANGPLWRRHAAIVKSGFKGPIPMDVFTHQSRLLFGLIGCGGRIHVNGWSQRYALAVVGTALLGYDFEAMGVPNPPFIERFNHVMGAIANPVYLVLPFLENIVPRPQIHKEIAVIHSAFDDLINSRRNNKGSDLISLMLEDETLSHDEVRENVITFFIASHDSSAGSISSLMYYLAASPEYQDRARAEVLSVLGPTRDPTVADLNDMPFVHACVHEVLRINTPVTSSVPRTCKSPVRLGQYAIPAHTSVMPNSYVWHHAAREWPDAYVFRPERWFDEKGNVKSSADGWLVFSHGPRRCPGRNFALHELRTFIAMLLREYEWSLPEDSIHRDGIKNAPSPFALSLPDQLHLDLRKREDARS